MTTNLFLDTRQSKPGCPSPIKIALGAHGKTAYISTEFKVLPSQWDKLTQSVIKHPLAMAYNVELAEQKLSVMKFIRENIGSGVFNGKTLAFVRDKVKNHLYNTCTVKGMPKVVDCFNYIIDSRRSDHTKQIYLSTLHALQRYDDQFDNRLVEDINELYIVNFEKHLKDEVGISKNTINAYMSKFNTIMLYAVEEGYIGKSPFRKFRFEKEKTKHRKLTVEELRLLFSLQGKKKQNDLVAFFKLTIGLIGANVNDIIRVMTNPGYNEGIIDGRFEYNRGKTGRHYSILLEPEVKDIYYDLQSRHRLFAAQGHISVIKRYHYFSKFFTDAGLPPVTTYYARHTWATIAHSIGISKDDISMCLGHSFGLSVTDIYIDYDAKRIDRANRKVLDYIFQVGEYATQE